MSTLKGFSRKKDLIECKKCNKSVQMSCFRQHLRSHEEGRFLCDICGVYKGKRKSLLALHKKSVHNVGLDSVHDCLFCNKKISSFSQLEVHLRSHTAERPYFCQICPGQFSSSRHLKLHISAHDPNETPKLYCSICWREFVFERHLREHIAMHSTSAEIAKPFKCDQCPKKFKCHGYLIKHMRVHTGEKPFVCEMCEKGFSQNSSLYQHIKTHLEEKAFRCRFCPKRFNTQQYAKLHEQKVHMKEDFKFICKECGKKFFNKFRLASHQLVHTGMREMKFSCKFCRKAFAHVNSLKAHLTTHTGERPYNKFAK